MFDEPRQRITTLADQCVKCGLCLPWCPTYGEDRLESESPRGRIALARALADGSLRNDADVQAHLDHCLGCLSCEKVCPSNVEYGELLVQTRALQGPSATRPALLLALITRPRGLRLALGLARLTRADRWLTPWSRRWRPDSAWRAALQWLPALMHAPASTSHTGSHHPVSSRRKPGPSRVALFPGCVASIADAEAQHAAQRLLQAAGFEVVMLPAMCCGAMDLHDGGSRQADAAARHVRAQWQRVQAEALVTITSGCLGTLRRALPGVSVEHAPTLLAGHADKLRFRALAARVALHLPCTQVNVADDGHALWHLLQRVPQLDVQLVPAPPTCCGAAGSHMLQFPGRATALRVRKQAQIRALAPDRWLSSNIGCRLHLSIDFDDSITHAHPLTLLAQQLAR